MSKMGYFPEDEQKQLDRIAELEARLKREEEERKQRQNSKQKRVAVSGAILFQV